jgi:hypothetical protein
MCSLFCQGEVRHGLLLSALCPAAMVGWKEQRATHEEAPYSWQAAGPLLSRFVLRELLGPGFSLLTERAFRHKTPHPCQ